jgi:hypothetical protein
VPPDTAVSDLPMAVSLGSVLSTTVVHGAVLCIALLLSTQDLAVPGFESVRATPQARESLSK